MKNIFETVNQYRIFQEIIGADGISRAQLARNTGLNRSTISYIVNSLMDENLIYESSQKVLTGGRASNLLYFNYNFHEIFLIDLQSKKVKVFITNLLGEQLALYNYPIVHQEQNSIQVLKEIITSITNAHPNIKHAGLSIHGTITTTINQINSPFYNYDFDELVTIFKENDLYLMMENESNIQTTGIKCIYEPKATNLINIHIKDGIGSGQIMNGQLYRGANGFAGEIGHSIALYNGLECQCGNRGCLEKYASESALEHQLLDKCNLIITMENINELLTNKDVLSIYTQVVDLLAIKINDLLLFSNPQTLYITSNLYGSITTFDTDIKSRLRSKNMKVPKIKVIIENTDIFTYGFANLIFGKIFKVPSLD